MSKNKKILVVSFNMQQYGIDSIQVAQQVQKALTEGLANDESIIKIVSDSSDELGIQFKTEEIELDELTATDANGRKYIPIYFKDSSKETK